MRVPVMLATAVTLVAAASPAHADGDATAGKVVFKQCMACHSVKAGENKIGPSLHNIVGRPSHSVEKFNYSPAMKAYDVTWEHGTLDHYLINPRETVPGTRMIFVGLKEEGDRKNLIAYLDTLR